MKKGLRPQLTNSAYLNRHSTWETYLDEKRIATSFSCRNNSHSFLMWETYLDEKRIATHISPYYGRHKGASEKLTLMKKGLRLLKCRPSQSLSFFREKLTLMKKGLRRARLPWDTNLLRYISEKLTLMKKGLRPKLTVHFLERSATCEKLTLMKKGLRPLPLYLFRIQSPSWETYLDEKRIATRQIIPLLVSKGRIRHASLAVSATVGSLRRQSRSDIFLSWNLTPTLSCEARGKFFLPFHGKGFP